MLSPLLIKWYIYIGKFYSTTSVPTQKTILTIGWKWFNLDRPISLCILKKFKNIYKKITASCRSPDFPLLSCLILFKDKNLSDGYYTWRLFSERWAISLMGITIFPDFRELSFRNLRVWRWNFRVKWIFTERVSWVGILKEKSERGEIRKKRIRRALADPKPISPCKQLYPLSQNRYFTHLMSYGSDWNVENFGDIYEKDNIFIDFLENFLIFLPV